MRFHYRDLFNTYSIIARDPDTGQFGVAVQTHQMSVGKRVPWLLPGLGAVASQASFNASFGPMALAMLREKIPAPQIIEALIASDPDSDRRQVAVVDALGRVAAHTGSSCIAEAGHYVGDSYSVQANMMTNETVINAMKHAYEHTSGDLATRLIASLQAAQSEDGDIRGMQSAAIKIVPGDRDTFEWASDYDLQVDEHQNPVEELTRLVRLRTAQLIDFKGLQLLRDDKRQEGLATWKEARELAPELEEIGFWQAVTLADQQLYEDSMDIAADILKQTISKDERRDHWIELIRRLQRCGIIERSGAAEDLISAFDRL